MLRASMIAAMSGAVLMFSPTGFAQQTSGTADEAKAMLMKAVAKALDMFNKGEGGFLDRDLYVLCANLSDGKLVAIGNPNAKQLLGTDVRTLKDATGKPFGAEADDGELRDLTYSRISRAVR